MGLRGKYNFINMARYGLVAEQTYRNQMSKTSLPVNKTQAGAGKENMLTKSMWIELIAAESGSVLKKETMCKSFQALSILLALNS